MPEGKATTTASAAAPDRDPQLELALDITKAASIVDRSRAQAGEAVAPGSEGVVARPRGQSARERGPAGRAPELAAQEYR
jgi:hypothetical protein